MSQLQSSSPAGRRIVPLCAVRSGASDEDDCSSDVERGADAVRWAAALPFIGWIIAIAGGAILLAVILLALSAALMRDRAPRTAASGATTTQMQ